MAAWGQAWPTPRAETSGLRGPTRGPLGRCDTPLYPQLEFSPVPVFPPQIPCCPRTALGPGCPDGKHMFPPHILGVSNQAWQHHGEAWEGSQSLPREEDMAIMRGAPSTASPVPTLTGNGNKSKTSSVTDLQFTPKSGNTQKDYPVGAFHSGGPRPAPGPQSSGTPRSSGPCPVPTGRGCPSPTLKASTALGARPGWNLGLGEEQGDLAPHTGATTVQASQHTGHTRPSVLPVCSPQSKTPRTVPG